MRKILLLTVVLFATITAKAQEEVTTTTTVDETDWSSFLDETTSLDQVEADQWADAHELLTALAEHPLDINTATADDLRQLPFLSENEIEEIQAYVYRYGPMKTLGELAMIRSLDYYKRQLLLHYVCIGTAAETSSEPRFPRWGNIFRYGKHDLSFTMKIPTYQRRGDDNGYRGYPLKHQLRYSFHYGNSFQAGLVASQDAGEPFLSNKNRLGYDFYSFYVVLRNMGRLKTLALGRYRLGFGSGLVINNDFSFGKSALLFDLGRNRQNIRAHSSTMQANYLQGAAATVSLAGSLDLSGFASWRKIDATLNDNGQIQTIRTDGYHRTDAELAHKNNAQQSLLGAHLGFHHEGFRLGATATYSHLDHPMQPAKAVFRQYYPRGSNFWNASIDYSYNSYRLTFNGETATGGSGGIATLNTLSFHATDELTLMAVGRYYGKRYYSLFSQAFGENSRVQNESGLLLGARWQPLRRLSLMAYADVAYFPWPRYQVSQASRSHDLFAQLSWQPASSWTVALRHRMRRRQQDADEATTLAWKTEHRSRLTLNYSNTHWTSRTQGDLAHTAFNGDRSFGWMVSQQLSFKPVVQPGKPTPWQFSAGIGYFRTDDFDSRLYSYERGLRYSFNFPVFYGEGLRYWFMATARLGHRLQASLKSGTTNYFGRATIGTELQEISHSAITDLELQFALKL